MCLAAFCVFLMPYDRMTQQNYQEYKNLLLRCDDT